MRKGAVPVSNQMTDSGRGGGDVLRVAINLLMCVRGDSLYSVNATVQKCLFLSCVIASH
jgi:hypothetical protein